MNSKQAQDIISSGLPIPNARIFLSWFATIAHASAASYQTRQSSTQYGGQIEAKTHENNFIFVFRAHHVKCAVVL